VLLIVLPLFVAFFRKFIPLASWTGNSFFTAIGTLLFFLAILSSFGWSFVRGMPGWHLARLVFFLLVVNAIFGNIIFFTFTYAFQKRH
jgi:hypothetical protein